MTLTAWVFLVVCLSLRIFTWSSDSGLGIFFVEFSTIEDDSSLVLDVHNLLSVVHTDIELFECHSDVV